MYFFFWTSFLYLPTFFFTLFFSLFFYTFISRLFWSFGIFVFFYNIEFFDFLVFNSSLLLLNPYLLEFNLLLTNTLNKIHPFIFYTSTILLFGTLYLTLIEQTISRKLYTYSWLSARVHRSSSLMLTLIFIALWLGSWWAFQEGTWGGWWNWDASEVFGLVFFLIPLYHVHKLTSLNQVLSIYYEQVLFLLTTLILYFFIQLNFDLVSHNFGVKFFFFFNNKLFFIVMLIFLSFLCWYIVRKYGRFVQNYWSLLQIRSVTLQPYNLYWSYLWLIFYCYWLGIIFLSFYPLVGFFIYNLVGWNFLNLHLTFIKFNFFLLLTFLWVFRFISFKSSVTILCLSSLTYHFYFLLIFTTSTLYFVNRLHFWLILFWLLNLLSYSSIFLLPWEVGGENLLSLINTEIIVLNPIQILDTLLLEEFNLFKQWGNFTLTTWNFSLYSNTSTIPTFLLCFSHSHTVSLYQLASSPVQLFVLIENNFTTVLTISVLWFGRDYVQKRF